MVPYPLPLVSLSPQVFLYISPSTERHPAPALLSASPGVSLVTETKPQVPESSHCPHKHTNLDLRDSRVLERLNSSRG